MKLHHLAVLLLVTASAACTAAIVEYQVKASRQRWMDAPKAKDEANKPPPHLRFVDKNPRNAYVGATACKGCHEGAYAAWANTAHATTAKRRLDNFGASMDMMFGDDCMACHATGWDPGTQNQGADEDGRLETMQNVQCEACHGPGKLHVETRDPTDVLVTHSPEVCARCHAERKPDENVTPPHFQEWAASGHATGVREVQIDPERDQHCLSCHSVDYILPLRGKAPAKLIEASHSVTCTLCHSVHAEKNQPAAGTGQLRVKAAELCQGCHQIGKFKGMYPQLISKGPHSPQTEVMNGTGGAHFEGVKYSSSPQTEALSAACMDCHAFDPRKVDFRAGGHDFGAALIACKSCHPDAKSFDYNGVQSRVRGLMAELKSLTRQMPGASLEAEWNLAFVERDGSLGVHNPSYVTELLESSIKFLKPEPEPAPEEEKKTEEVEKAPEATPEPSRVVVPGRTPVTKEPARAPATSGDGEKPAEGDGEKPAEGDGEKKPAEGDGEKKPAEGEKKPAEGEDAAEKKPAEGKTSEGDAEKSATEEAPKE